MLRIMSYPISMLKNIIGGSMDFSLDEKKVGTWIDGRPVYQKTFHSNLPASVPVNSMITLQDLSDLNIETIIHLDGIYYVNSNNRYSMNSYNGILMYNNTNLQWYTIHSNLGSKEYTCTILYTKTTD